MLQQGVAIQSRLAAQIDQESKLRASGNAREADALKASPDRIELLDAVRTGLAARVRLLRQMNPAATIDHAYPRVRAETPEQRASRSAGEISALFETGDAAAPAEVEAGRELTEEELQQFEVACMELAEKTGYPGSHWSHGMLSLARNYAAGKEHRNLVRVDLMVQPYPSTDGITGQSRITEMDVFALKWGYGESIVMQYGARQAIPNDAGDYHLVCTDPIVQNEIDRAIAIFG